MPLVKTVLVYLHGLWFSGTEGIVLRRRLVRALGAEDRVFSYPTVRATISENADRFGAYLRGIDTDRLHIVAHSLGGLVVWRSFQQAPPLPPGRIVLLGSPLNGCLAADGLARLPGGRRVMGRGMAEEVLGPHSRRWSGSRELGTIAGSRGLGLGRLVARLQEPHDGTVAVAETRLAGASDAITLNVSHTGLLFSARAAAQALHFLTTGRFDHAAGAAPP